MKLTEKNLEAALLNLTTTDKPITIKPTTWFGNPAKTAQWYKCPNCAKQSPLTLEWVGLTDEDKHLIELSAGITEDDDGYIVSQVFKLTEAKLRSKNT